MDLMDFIWLTITRISEKTGKKLLNYNRLAEEIFYQIEGREPTIDDYDKIQKIKEEIKRLQAYGALLYDSESRSIFLLKEKRENKKTTGKRLREIVKEEGITL